MPVFFIAGIVGRTGDLHARCCSRACEPLCIRAQDGVIGSDGR